MKNILLVIDQRGWIFERHAFELKKRLSEYRIDIVCHRENIREKSKDYDLIYVFDPMPLSYPPPNKTIMGLRVDWFYLNHPRGAKGMYEEGFMGRSACIKGNCCMMHVVNRNQLKAFEEVADIPVLLTQHGIDEECFNRSKYVKPKNDILTVGTSGRKDSPNKKSFNLVDQVCREMGIKHYKTRYRGKRTKEEMPEFYNRLDIFVSMSKYEGLCNPIMEAGAMGVPVISTRCGAAEEIIRDGESGLLISRSVMPLKEALEKMRDEEVRLEMGNKLHEEIMKNWTWKTRIEDFRNMFNKFFETR